MNKKYSISFVIPVYKSEKTIEFVVDEISKIANIDWQIVLVNDNSPDNVEVAIKKLIKKHPKKIIYLRFRKNYGQHAATIEGFKYATKKYVTTIDDDGQNPPIEVLKMIKVMLENDYDVVYGIPKENKHSFIRKIVSKANNFISIITINNKKKIPTSNVRLMKSNIANYISKMSNNYNYIEGSIFLLTDHIGYVYINNESRIYGKSSYNLLKLIKLWLNHIIGYSNIFIKIISIVSFSISLIAFLIGLIYLFSTIDNTERPLGWLSIYLTITFLFSIVFLVLGILIIYVGRIYTTTNQNTKKIISKKINIIKTTN